MWLSSTTSPLRRNDDLVLSTAWSIPIICKEDNLQPPCVPRFSLFADCCLLLIVLEQVRDDPSVVQSMTLSDCSLADHETCFGDQAVGH